METRQSNLGILRTIRIRSRRYMFDMNKIEEQRLLTYFLFICFNYKRERLSIKKDYFRRGLHHKQNFAAIFNISKY